MWATVGAALKKIAVALLGNPKVLKTIGGIVLGLIIIIVMPVVAIVSIFNGDIEIDTNELQRMVVENLSAEEQAKLQFVEDTMYAIEREMKASGFSDPRVTEAQVLFMMCPSEKSGMYSARKVPAKKMRSRRKDKRTLRTCTYRKKGEGHEHQKYDCKTDCGG